MNKLLVSIIVLVLFLTGCAANRMSEDKYSGFLDNYDQLVPSKKYPQTRLYIAPDANFSSYSAYMIDPVYVVLPGGMAQPEDQLFNNIAKTYHDELIAAFEAEGFTVVNEIGPNVARITSAVTGVYSSADGTFSKTKARIIMEGKVTDATTSKLLGSVIDLQTGQTLKSAEDIVTLDSFRPVLRAWARRFANAMATL